ncbi:DUF4012 domain-containing protein [Candidatus Curtissbacteria bacterium]|nr:DUF4012 domain-containing protein [Candidatus Curtissbacteria bacterium]
MENSAPQKTQVFRPAVPSPELVEGSRDGDRKLCLITNVGTYLGRELAKSLLSQGCAVYGLTKSHLPHDLLAQKDFTLLELDLAQPFPHHLPQFNLIFYLAHENSPFTPGLSAMPHISPDLHNVLLSARLGKAKVAITLPITTDPQIYDYLAKTQEEKENLRLFLLGDLYGPAMDLALDTDLVKLISQALSQDKVILENEGLSTIYPSYISDITSAITKLVYFGHTLSKNVHILASQSPMTALSAAYEIQKAARLHLAKELNLYFAKAQSYSPKSQEIIKIHDLGFSPEVDFPEGLKRTFAYFAKPDTKIGRHWQASPPEPRLIPVQRKVEEEPSSLKNIVAKIPRLAVKKPPGRHSRRTVLFIIAALVMLFIGKTALDTYMGINRVKSAQTAALAGDFKKAQSQAAKAAGSFKSAASKINKVLWPASFIIPQKTQSISYTFDSAESLAQSIAHLAAGAGALSEDFLLITQKEAKDKVPDLESPQADFQEAYFTSARALELAKKAKAGTPFPSVSGSLHKAAQGLNSLSFSAFELSSLVTGLTGQSTGRSYLILLANNTELRPGGGFIGNIALVDFENGRLKNITVEDVYTLDGQLKEKITPPREIKEKLGTDSFYLRDSLWSPDFALNAQIARDFFKKETGKNVDGVISFDLTFIQEILQKTGSIKLSDYSEEITHENLFEKGEYYSEVGFFPGSTQKRDFFGALSRALINKLLASPPALSLLEVMRDGLTQKHLMFTFDNPSLAAYVRTHSWDRPLPPSAFNPGDDTLGTRDFLALSEANLGANKVNRLIDRKIEYVMTIGRDADLVANLKITYTNNSQAETWPAGKYLNYLRVYTPGLITLLSVNGSPEIDPKVVQVATLGSLSSISTYVEVPVKSTKEVTFSYRLPKSIKLETAPAYHLYVQKQPGTGSDPFEFKFNLPGYLIAKSVNGQDQSTQNLVIKTDLLTDREFKVEVAKK